MQNQKLGKGLSALLNTKISAKIENIAGDKLDFISINLIDSNPNQPRKIFDNDLLLELSESIKANGVLQPIVVYKNNDRYIVVAGERRWRAAKMANITHIPAIVKELSDRKIIELALIENIQRQDLNAIDEAESYSKLIAQFNCTQEDLAVAVGKSRSYIANIVRLNDLPESIKQKVRSGAITQSKARALIGVENAEEIAETIATQHLNAREVESITRLEKKASKKNATKNLHDTDSRGTSGKKERVDLANSNNDPQLNDLKIIADMLSEKYNVVIEFKCEKGKYQMLFHLNDFEELDRILSKIG